MNMNKSEVRQHKLPQIHQLKEIPLRQISKIREHELNNDMNREDMHANQLKESRNEDDIVVVNKKAKKVQENKKNNAPPIAPPKSVEEQSDVEQDDSEVYDGQLKRFKQNEKAKIDKELEFKPQGDVDSTEQMGQQMHEDYEKPDEWEKMEKEEDSVVDDRDPDTGKPEDIEDYRDTKRKGIEKSQLFDQPFHRNCTVWENIYMLNIHKSGSSILQNMLWRFGVSHNLRTLVFPK